MLLTSKNLQDHQYTRMLADITKLRVHRNELTHEGIIYYIKICEHTGTWEVTCLGIECVDSYLAGTYYYGKRVPALLQERVTVLSMLEPNSPEVEGVGIRSSENGFWVYD